VVATCGGEAKAEMLTRLGADRVINYRNEKVRDVLRTEFKKGVDLVYESVGGEFFATAVDALAPGGAHS
jgi:NADPH:quinone reductase-like Zn-dependent oxidoreductase